MIIQDGGIGQIRIGAPAKINVGLKILGRRPDNYHEIWTILQQIDLEDEIVLQDELDLSFSLETDLTGIPDNDDNLCMQAARLLRRETGTKRGAHIHLKKRIPAGAGLGGGSSDAAATLKALNQLWELGWDDNTLRKMASQLGSDVPFFISGGCCIATGRGEKLQAIDRVINDPILLICPSETVSTTWAYKNIKNYHLTSNRENIIFHGSISKKLYTSSTIKTLTNDFEPLVFVHYPLLKDIKEELLVKGAYYASLSGSGSSLFGVFFSAEEAIAASEQMSYEGQFFVLG